MSDVQVLVLTGAVAAAALAPVYVGDWSWIVRVVVATGVIVGWRRRRPVMLIAMLVAFTALNAGAAWHGINAPVTERPFAGIAELATDPAPAVGGVRARARIDGRVYDIRAWGSPAGWLRNRLMGERVTIQASLRPLGPAPLWLRSQGVAGRATITRVTGFAAGQPHTRLANALRRTIESGAASLSRSDRALFTGLVYGDDRQQSPLVADNFAGAGLTHLLAVSGQNVAFILAIAGPVLRRVGHRQRFVVVLALLLVFATMTRFEPSVIRASVMTSIAATGVLVGTAVPSKRVLMLAVAGLLATRPLLVHSVAFQLSVAASAGILLWSGRLGRSIPGPRPLVDAVAVTASAQLAVAPLLLWRFDGLPAASLPANILAGPVAGPIMMWGMTAGWVAGLVPASVATLVHVPTKVGLWWIDGVAQWSARQPLGHFSWAHVVVIGGAAWAGLRSQESTRRAVGAVIGCIALMAPAIGVALGDSAAMQHLGNGSTVHRDDRTTVLEIGQSDRPADLLAGLRTSNIGRIDLVVAGSSSFAMRDLIGWIDDRHGIDQVWAPRASMGVGESVPAPGSAVRIHGTICTAQPVAEIDGNDLRLACDP